jgi:ubiquinone/menaquinone biosynthesis C-methylase UbiE
MMHCEVKKEMRQQLDMVSKAYDLSVEQYEKGIDPLDTVPEEFKETHEFQEFVSYLKTAKQLCGSGARDIEKFLKPESHMRFLDVGCCANIANYRLDTWPSVYHGVDISPALIDAMKDFVAARGIHIGGLWVADAANLPFEDNYFDICAVIGVFEYCTLDYTKQSLTELNHVLKSYSKMVLDIPNPEHKFVDIMMRVEKYLGRPNMLHPREEFERLLKSFFSIEHLDDSQVMLKYYVKSNK